MFLDDSLIDRIFSLNRVTNTDRLEVALRLFINQHRFEHYFFIINTRPSFTHPEPLCLHNLPADWCHCYSRDALVRTDPIADYVQRHAAPVNWRRMLQDPAYSTGDFRRVMTQRRHYGLCSGCTVPLRGPFCWFSLSSPVDDVHMRENIESFLPYAALLGQVVLDVVLRCADIAVSDRGCLKVGRGLLNQRQKECLCWASEGKTNSEIGQILSISERTVVYHIKAACKTLVARNRQQAVTRAMLSGQLSPERVSLHS